MSRAAIPSPTAEPSCLVDPERTSPAAKTPAMDVSMVGLVTRKPPASRSTLASRNALLGFSPMNTKAAAAGKRSISLLSRSRATTAATGPSPGPAPPGGQPAPPALELDDVDPGADVELRVGPHPFLEHG